MTTLNDVLDLSSLESAISEGYVRQQVHPSAPLAILNYTERAQYERVWTPVTKACRGLIYNTRTLEVMSRPFAKFANFDESGWPYPPPGPVLRMPKMDGSLGILYWVDEQPLVATRGSFASEQAIHASKVLKDTLRDNPVEFRHEKTYLFEIIAPWNRIVVQYGDLDALVLLDVIDTSTGRADLVEFDVVDWPLKVERLALPSFDHGQISEIPEGEEGFVFLWPERNYRVKMKAAAYVALHRIVTGLNERTVWSAFGPDGNGVSLQKFCEPLPDEFHPWVEEVVTRLKTEQTRVLAEVAEDYAEITTQLEMLGLTHRRDFAQLATKTPYPGYLFLMLDRRHDQLRAKVWDSLKPEGAKYAKQVSEDVA